MEIFSRKRWRHSYWPNCQAYLAIVHHELSLLICNFINSWAGTSLYLILLKSSMDHYYLSKLVRRGPLQWFVTIYKQRSDSTVWPDKLHYLLSVWPFTTMKFCPKAYKICQEHLKILPNTKWTFSKWPKVFNGVPMWQNFDIYGHTAALDEDFVLTGRTFEKKPNHSVS